jgi:hypothetical protein
MIDDVFNEFGEMFTAGNVAFYFSGYLSQPMLTAMVESFKVKLERDGVVGANRRKLLSALIEMTQNIIHYAEDTLTPADQDDQQLRWGSIAVTLTEGHYLLECANRVTVAQAQTLTTRLDALRLMTTAEIKEAYTRAIREEAPDDSKGAGLGLLTVARDASGPLKFKVIDDQVKPGTQLFFLQATI